MKKQILNEEFKRMQLLAGLITESQLGEAAGEDLELKSLAKKLFPIIKKYKMGVEYVTDTNEFNTKPQKTDPSFQVPAKILIKDGILTLAVYFLSLAKSINELDMGSGPSSEQYDNAKKQAALMYKDIAGVIGNEFEFRSQPTTNEYGFYLIQIRKKITAKGGATNPNQRPNAPKPAAPVPTSESIDIEKSVNEALKKFRESKLEENFLGDIVKKLKRLFTGEKMKFISNPNNDENSVYGYYQDDEGKKWIGVRRSDLRYEPGYRKSWVAIYDLKDEEKIKKAEANAASGNKQSMSSVEDPFAGGDDQGGYMKGDYYPEPVKVINNETF